MALTIAEREHQRFANILSEFGFSDTDDVPLSEVLRSSLVQLKHRAEAAEAQLRTLREPSEGDAVFDWRLVKIGEVGPKQGGHGSWVETDHPAVIACMGSEPACIAGGCQLARAEARLTDGSKGSA